MARQLLFVISAAMITLDQTVPIVSMQLILLLMTPMPANDAKSLTLLIRIKVIPLRLCNMKIRKWVVGQRRINMEMSWRGVAPANGMTSKVAGQMVPTPTSPTNIDSLGEVLNLLLMWVQQRLQLLLQFLLLLQDLMILVLDLLRPLVLLYLSSLLCRCNQRNCRVTSSIFNVFYEQLVRVMIWCSKGIFSLIFGMSKFVYYLL